jgi:hypothetical protein
LGFPAAGPLLCIPMAKYVRGVPRRLGPLLRILMGELRGLQIKCFEAFQLPDPVRIY